jgi:phosphohistidine phosphatase SixA
MRRFRSILIAILAATAVADAQTLSGPALIKALQGGGHVIVMRHASSPSEIPDKQKANPDNVPPERQLDERGRATATAMGNALRRLKIPVGQVMTSPTYRARETARLAQLPFARPTPELGETTQTMQADAAQVRWLQQQVRAFPRGTNTVLITHVPNMSAAFPDAGAAAEQGEAFVFGPDGTGGARLLGRIKIAEWADF